MKLKLPETAPKDKLILIDIGWPSLVTAIWSDYDKQWKFASLQYNHVEGVQDPYFETDFEHDKYLKGWMPLPTCQ